MEKKLDITCPFCGEKGNVESYEDRMHCTLCDTLFDDEDIIREDIRHQVSHILIDTDEDDQMQVRILLSGPVKSVDTFLDEKTLAGLNGLDEIVVDRMYQIPGDGTIWLRVEGFSSQNNGLDEELWLAFDDLSTEDLRKVLQSIEGLQGGELLEVEVSSSAAEAESTDDITDGEIGLLWEDMGEVANAIAEEAGANIDYSASMDFSYLPYIVAVMAPDECDGFLDDISVQDLLDSFTFLAENDGWLPETLVGSSLQGFKDYIVANRKALAEEIRSVIEGYYEEYLGTPYNK